MSTRYGYHCKTCNETSEYWINHGGEALEELYLVHLFQIKYSLKSYVVVNLQGYGYDPNCFLEEHDSHDICLENEYDKRPEFIRKELIEELE